MGVGKEGGLKQLATVKGRPKFRKTIEKIPAFRMQALLHIQKSKLRSWIYFALVPRAIIADLAVSFPDLSRRLRTLSLT